MLLEERYYHNSQAVLGPTGMNGLNFRGQKRSDAESTFIQTIMKQRRKDF